MSGPRLGSRYLFCVATANREGALELSDREPFRYRELADSRVHTIAAGDTLWHLAGRCFAPLARAEGYWWAIADFQPEPIVDPTLELVLGATLVIPSVRTLTDLILADPIRRPRS